VTTILRFEDIEAWQKARELARVVYELSGAARFSRDFVLRDQVRRAAVSIMSNIAEGFERDGNKEFLQFLAMAKGSCGELRSHLCIGLDQQYIAQEQYESVCERAVQVSRMIAGLIRHLRQSEMRGRKYS
jgi:four helix bundle protein